MADLGIYHYNARFYAPKLGRFLSADTIALGLENPQNWNRYTYTLNNPIKFNDPSGHRQCTTDSNGEWDKEEELWNYAEKTFKRLRGKKELEAVARIVIKSHYLFRTYDEMIPRLSEIFLGIRESNSRTVYNAVFHNPDPCSAIGRPNPNAFFGDEGFHEDFRDRQSQPFHFWAYLATAANTEGAGPASYLLGRIVSNIANNIHEIIWTDGPGATWQDYTLARAGMNIGTLVNIGAVPPDQLGNTIRDYIGTDGPGAPYVAPLKIILPLEGNR